MSMTAITWALTAASIVGVILNIRQHRGCFAIWLVTNASWAVIDYYRGIHAQAALFAVYFVLSVWGLIQWSRNHRRGRKEST